MSHSRALRIAAGIPHNARVHALGDVRRPAPARPRHLHAATEVSETLHTQRRHHTHLGYAQRPPAPTSRHASYSPARSLMTRAAAALSGGLHFRYAPLDRAMMRHGVHDEQRASCAEHRRQRCRLSTHYTRPLAFRSHAAHRHDSCIRASAFRTVRRRRRRPGVVEAPLAPAV